MEIAIIAHDGKKAEMVQFLNQHKSKLQEKKITIISTGTTGNKVENAGIEVTKLFSGPSFDWLLVAFQGSMFEIANSSDTRTLILEIFIFISLFFTLLTIPFIELLRRDLRKQGIKIVLNEADD